MESNLSNNKLGWRYRLHRSLKMHKFIYLLVIPGILYYIIFHYLPMFGIIMAFKDVSPFEGVKGIFTSPWVGFKHFKYFINSYYFGRLIRNTLNFTLRSLIFGFPAPIILALLFNEIKNRKFLKVTQTISYLPHFLSTVIIVSFVRSIFNPDRGPITVIYNIFGMESQYLLDNFKAIVNIIVFTQIWASVGWGSIIYLATITSIDQQQYEAAIIDGAGKWRQLFSITLPAISGVIAITLIFSIGGLLSANFEYILLLSSQSTIEVTDVIDTFVYREGIGNINYSFVTAVGLFKSVISLLLIVGANKVAKMLGHEGIW